MLSKNEMKTVCPLVLNYCSNNTAIWGALLLRKKKTSLISSKIMSPKILSFYDVQKTNSLVKYICFLIITVNLELAAIRRESGKFVMFAEEWL